MGQFDGQKIPNAQDWEQPSEGRQGDRGLDRRADALQGAVVVLVGNEIATRRWIRYEITRASASLERRPTEREVELFDPGFPMEAV